jgi:hypothetical protein
VSDSPREDEALHVVRRDESQREPPGFYNAASRPEQGSPNERLIAGPGFSSISTFSFVGGFLLLVLAIGAIWIYFSQQEPPRPQPLANRDIKRKPALSQTFSITPIPPPGAGEAFVPITPQIVHVTSIALGDVPLAIVNGKRVAEGDWLAVTVAGREIFLQVTKIEDGVVHLVHGEQVIDARLAAAISKTPGPP